MTGDGAAYGLPVQRVIERAVSDINEEWADQAGIPQIKPPFLDIAPAGIPPNIIPHSKSVKCGLMRPDSLKVPAFIGQPLYCQA